MTGDMMIRFARAALLGLACCLASLSPSTASDYPNRPVRWLIGFAAGGPVDIVARIMSQWLSDRLGQQFVVENRAGSGGNSSATVYHAVSSLVMFYPGQVLCKNPVFIVSRPLDTGGPIAPAQDCRLAAHSSKIPRHHFHHGCLARTSTGQVTDTDNRYGEPVRTSPPPGSSCHHP